MKTRLVFGLAAAGCALAVAFPPRAAADISDDQFNELKKLVIQQGKKTEEQDKRIEQLEKSHSQDQKALEEDQKVHEQDQQKIQQLEQQLRATQQTVTNTEQKVTAAALLQPVPRVPIDEATVNHNFSILGDAEFQYAKTSGQHGAFLFADFAPIFLYRGGENVLFEAGFDFILQNNAPASPGETTTVNLSFAQLDYLFNDYVTLVAGDMVLPLGTYSERAAGWLNKIPDNPLPRSVLPGSGIGVQLRGAKAIGESGQMVTYAIYGVNGPSSTNGLGDATFLDLNGNVGDTANWHSDPSAGGRIGWFYPLKAHYDVELGLSGQSGTWDDAGKKLWSATVVDAALHLSPYVEVKGEWIYTWEETDDHGTIAPRGWWVQAGYRLGGFGWEVPMINNVELVYRYDQVNDAMGTGTDRNTVGCVYYITNTFQFEGDYEFIHSTDRTQANNQLIV